MNEEKPGVVQGGLVPKVKEKGIQSFTRETVFEIWKNLLFQRLSLDRGTKLVSKLELWNLSRTDH